jgi:pimeloyl-ACP methyl ester carboxylesterase
VPRQHQPPQDVRFVEANGLRFGTLEWGQGPLVLLCHGFPDTAFTWDFIGPKLAAAGFRAVAPFMRGYAPTALPPRDTTTKDLGEDVVALIDALGSKTATLVGHDWGAEAVYAAVGLAPKKVEKLVTFAVPHRGALKPTLRIAWGLRHFAALSRSGAARRYAEGDFAATEVLYRRWSPTWKFGPEELEPVKNAFAAPGCLEAALGYYRAAALLTPAFMKTPTLVPTLCVYGTDDPALTAADFEHTRPFFKGGLTLAPISGGHFCHRESPTSALTAITAFLGQP